MLYDFHFIFLFIAVCYFIPTSVTPLQGILSPADEILKSV